MNPKTVNDLDPKLKETYERVMGTSFSPSANPIPAPVMQRPIQTTVVEQPVAEQSPQAVVQPLPPLPQQPAANPMQEMVPSPQMTKMPTTFQATAMPPANVLIKNATTTKKKNFLKPVLFTVGGIIFFIVYGVVWAKVFGLF
jgi:hypothetical protein